MNRCIYLFCFIIVSSLSAFAQNSGDYNKNEFFAGGLVQRTDTSNSRIPLDSDKDFGFEVSYVRNVSRYFGIKGDVSGAFGSTTVITNVRNAPDFSIRTREKRDIYNFLGGVQIKDNESTDRIKPIAHALIGVGHIRDEVSNTCISGDCPDRTLFRNVFSANGFSAAVGTGFDIKLNDRIEFRAFVDYNPIYSNGRVKNNTRFSFGVVFK